MPSDFTIIMNSGKACCCCGRTSDQVTLTKLDTYARAYACWTCFRKHWNCASCFKSCTKTPHSGHPCPTCACLDYRHSIAAEFDRQYEACVGKPQVSKTCTGYGANLGKCDHIVFAAQDGTINRLCDSCQRSWIVETKEGARQAEALNKLDTKLVLPN